MHSKWGQGNPASQLKQLSRVATALGGNDAGGGPPPRGWLCKQKECAFALQGIRNYPERTHCWGCYKARAVAQKATDTNKNNNKDEGVNDGTGTTTKEAKRREARARRRQAAVDYQKAKSPPTPPSPTPPTPDGPGPVATAMSQLAAQPGVKRLSFSAELEEQTPLLTEDVMKSITDSLHCEIIPLDLEDRNPEVTLNKFIGEKGPTAKAARRAELEAVSAKFKAAIASLQGGGDAMTGAIADLQAKLDANEAALSKVIKDQPTQGHERKAVVEAKSKFEVAMQARKDREDQGLAKAQERRKERHQHIAKLKAQLDLVDADLIRMENENEAKYKSRAVKAQEQDTEVIKLFDKKLESLQAQTATDMDTSAGPTAGTLALQPNSSQPVQVAAPELAEYAAMKKRVEELEAKIKVAAEKETKEFEIRFEDIQATALPAMEIPDKKELPAYMSLLQVLNNWHVSGAAMPFNWGTLSKVTADGPKPADMCRKLLGGTWEKWYGQAGPLDSAVVPRQVALLAHYSLNANKDKFEDKEAQKEVDKRAEQGMESIRGSAKRIRTG